ncbi:MAG: glycosyltransferase, partial [Bacteroidales bacterium]|nr:glycosyltransferase [Bacteroidales bacterium]
MTFLSSNAINRVMFSLNKWFINEYIVLSNIFKDEFKSKYHQTNTRVLPNTSSIETSKIQENKTYQHKYLCISNYIPSKGLKELVECFSLPELNELHLDIYGNNYDQGFKQELDKIKSTNINLHGALERNELERIFQQYDCLILPSWNEGQPITILESISLGIPVVATRVGDIPNILGTDYSYLAIPKNISSLKQAILNFNQCKDKNQLSLLLHKRYSDNYSNKQYRKNVLEIFSI